MEFKAYIEELMAIKKICLIKFRAANGAISIIHDGIDAKFWEGDEEIIRTKQGLNILLKNLIEVDGKEISTAC